MEHNQLQRHIPKSNQNCVNDRFRLQVSLKKGNILNVECDAIVNAANTNLVKGGGIDKAIRDAGGDAMENELKRHRQCPLGACVVTKSYGIRTAKYVFHTAGPDLRSKRNKNPSKMK